MQNYGVLLCPHVVFQKEEYVFAQRVLVQDTWYVHLFAVKNAKAQVSVVTECGNIATFITDEVLTYALVVPCVRHFRC